jgi:hypothetical protein
MDNTCLISQENSHHPFNSTKIGKKIIIPVEDQIDVRTHLSNFQEFTDFSYSSPDLLFCRSKMIKFVIQYFNEEFQTYSPMIYFLNSKKYQSHYPFCLYIWEYFAQHFFGSKYHFPDGNFDSLNYQHFPINFLLLTFVYYEDKDLFTVEMWPSDNLPHYAIKEAHQIISANSFFEDNFKWAILGPDHDVNFKLVEIEGFYENMTIRNSDFFNQIDYQPASFGETFGVIKICKSSEQGELDYN